jgi:hypothetical protein
MAHRFTTGDDWRMEELLHVRIAFVSRLPLTWRTDLTISLFFRAMMIAGKTPVVDVTNATITASSAGNNTVPALSFWQVVQSYFSTNTTSTVPLGGGETVVAHPGIIRRIIGAVVARKTGPLKQIASGMFTSWTR